MALLLPKKGHNLWPLREAVKMKIMDRFWSYYFLNPVAWVFLAFFVMAEYQC